MQSVPETISVSLKANMHVVDKPEFEKQKDTNITYYRLMPLPTDVP